jgi:hypothetical protein
MALAERRRRSPPSREGPNRAVLPGADEATIAPDAPASASAAGREPPDAVVDQAVAAAYRVVEQNVEQGRRAAERLRAAAQEAHGPAPNAREAAGRLLHITRDLGAAWVDLLAAMLREPEVKALVERVTLHDRQRPPPAGYTAPASLIQRVRSRKPLEVTLSAMPPLDAPPATAGLLALDATSAPLRDIRFALEPAGGLELQITVPDDQPADVYTGTVVDGASRLPIGALTVRVLE